MQVKHLKGTTAVSYPGNRTSDLHTTRRVPYPSYYTATSFHCRCTEVQSEGVATADNLNYNIKITIRRHAS
uniref:Uncharacterized protein n=1 Tax=Anguilla anguilla TaxID=7936 RepID=A0A0E9XN34_ANGAN